MAPSRTPHRNFADDIRPFPKLSQQRGQTGDPGGQKVLPDRPENATPVKNGLIRHPDEEMEQESCHKNMDDNGWIL